MQGFLHAESMSEAIGNPLPTLSVTEAFERRAYRLATGPATIAIIGIGYVGAPLAQAALEAECNVIAFDIDTARLDALEAGESYIDGVSFDAFAIAARVGRLELTSDAAALADADAILLCVPTPIDAAREPDLSLLRSAIEQIAGVISPHCLVVIESTTWPGTTAELAAPIIEQKRGWTRGEDFFIAYSPEREDPGNRTWGATTIPKIIGGDDPRSAHLGMCLYRRLVEKPICVQSTRIAEAAKLVENTFRAVNIGLVNELKMLFTGMGLDVWEIIEAAATKPFGFMPFYPGPGVGGHCIPVDPHYLSWKARTLDLSARYIDLTAEINVAMPGFVVSRVAEALDATQRRGLHGADVLVLGVSYKADVRDIRGSSALKILELLTARGANVRYHDPFVPQVTVGSATMPSTPLTTEHIAQADVVLILADHSVVDLVSVVSAATVVVDTRNACIRRQVTPKHLFKA